MGCVFTSAATSDAVPRTPFLSSGRATRVVICVPNSITTSSPTDVCLAKSTTLTATLGGIFSNHRPPSRSPFFPCGRRAGDEGRTSFDTASPTAPSIALRIPSQPLQRLAFASGNQPPAPQLWALVFEPSPRGDACLRGTRGGWPLSHRSAHRIAPSSSPIQNPKSKMPPPSFTSESQIRIAIIFPDPSNNRRARFRVIWKRPLKSTAAGSGKRITRGPRRVLCRPIESE